MQGDDQKQRAADESSDPGDAATVMAYREAIALHHEVAELLGEV